MLRTLQDKVVVLPIADSGKIGSGILYGSDAHQKRAKQGIVIEVGPGVREDEVAIGDHVVFSAFAGERISVGELGTMIVMTVDQLDLKLDGEEVRRAGLLLSMGQLEELMRDWVGRQKQKYPTYRADEAMIEFLEFFDYVRGEMVTRQFEPMDAQARGELKNLALGGES
jgi:co-chaperonin GroES (HSP10)